MQSVGLVFFNEISNVLEVVQLGQRSANDVAIASAQQQRAARTQQPFEGARLIGGPLKALQSKDVALGCCARGGGRGRGGDRGDCCC